jgi:hypothetical protein
MPACPPPERAVMPLVAAAVLVSPSPVSAPRPVVVVAAALA